MAGEIEEPFRLNFQADLLHSGSISFGRFESESLSWERRSIFSHNRYLEEVEKYSKPGTVTEKKAYFEAEFRRKALLKQRSAECQEGNGVEDSDNCNKNEEFTYFGDSPCSSGPFEYNKETEIQQYEERHVKPLYAENSNWSSPHNSEYDNDNISQECESQNREVIPVATQNEPVIDMVNIPVKVADHVKLDETDPSETENVVGVGNTEESIGLTIVDQVVLVDAASEANDSSLTCQTLEKDDDSISFGPRKIISAKVKPASEKKLSRTTPKKTQSNVERFQKPVSNESSKGSMKPKTSETKSPLIKKTEKKSPRPASPFTSSRVKTSKPEDKITSSKEKDLRLKKSIVKDLKSEKTVKPRSSLVEKPLPGVRPTPNRPKPTNNLSKSQIVQSTPGFSFKTNQRAENRKEFDMKIAQKLHAKEAEINQVVAKTQEKQAAEIKQFRRSLNFKAKPMPSFYNESPRGSDQHKVTPISKTPNQRPSSHSGTPNPRPSSHSGPSHRIKNASKPLIPSSIRPSSSTSLINRIRLSESVVKNNVPKKKDEGDKSLIIKHKDPVPKARDMVRKNGRYLIVGVAC